MTKGLIKYTLLVSVVIISMMLIYSSMLKFLDPMWENQFLVWGYSTTFLYIIGAVELIIGVMVFAKPLRLYGFIALLILMTGALYTHISNYEYGEIATALFLIGLTIGCLILMWFDKKINSSKV